MSSVWGSVGKWFSARIWRQKRNVHWRFWKTAPKPNERLIFTGKPAAVSTSSTSGMSTRTPIMDRNVCWSWWKCKKIIYIMISCEGVIPSEILDISKYFITVYCTLHGYCLEWEDPCCRRNRVSIKLENLNSTWQQCKLQDYTNYQTEVDLCSWFGLYLFVPPVPIEFFFTDLPDKRWVIEKCKKK